MSDAGFRALSNPKVQKPRFSFLRSVVASLPTYLTGAATLFMAITAWFTYQVSERSLAVMAEDSAEKQTLLFEINTLGADRALLQQQIGFLDRKASELSDQIATAQLEVSLLATRRFELESDIAKKERYIEALGHALDNESRKRLALVEQNVREQLTLATFAIVSQDNERNFGRHFPFYSIVGWDGSKNNHIPPLEHFFPADRDDIWNTTASGFRKIYGGFDTEEENQIASKVIDSFLSNCAPSRSPKKFSTSLTYPDLAEFESSNEVLKQANLWATNAEYELWRKRLAEARERGEQQRAAAEEFEAQFSIERRRYLTTVMDEIFTCSSSPMENWDSNIFASTFSIGWYEPNSIMFTAEENLGPTRSNAAE